MLPTIDSKLTIKKSISMSKTNNIKNNPTSSYYYKGNPISKDNSPKTRNLEGYNNKNYNYASKKSKIMNNSTNNNSTNNSNFYENLYYYPPHSNKYSYVNSISSEVCFLYSDFNFNKAPSLRQNFSGIRNMINKRKKNKIHYLNNLFFSSVCGKRQSKPNIDEYFGEKNLDLETRKKNIIKPGRNNSCIEFKKNIFKEDPIKNNKNTHTNSNKNTNYINRYINSGSVSTTTYKTINTNRMIDISKDNIKYNSRNTKNANSESKNNNFFVDTIQEFTQLPNIANPTNIQNAKQQFSTIDIANKDKGFTVFDINKNLNQSSFLTHLNTENMKFKLNECLYESKDNIKKLNEFEIKIYHMKIFQGFQKAQLNLILDKEVYNVQKYVDYIEKIFHKFAYIHKIYNFSFLEYIKYLKEIITKMDNELKILIYKHIQLEYDVDGLLNKNIGKQRELEKSIDIRNFLYRVKHKDEKIPDIDSTFLIESKKFLLAKCLSRLFEKDNNITVIKYLSEVPDKIPDFENIDDSKFIVRNCPPLLRNNINDIINANLEKQNLKNNVKNKKKRNKLKEKEIESQNEQEKQQMSLFFQKNVFTEPDELIQIIKYLEDQNRFLLRQNENKRMIIEKYKEDLEECIPQEEKEIEKKIIAEIEDKKIELEKIKNKNYILTQKFNNIKNINLKNDIFKKTTKKTKKSEVGKSSFADFNYFQTLSYHFQIKKAKYPGMVFFSKLLKYFLNFLKINYDSFTKEKFYTHIHSDYLNEILEYNNNMEFNDRNYFLIYQYTLKLLKLYEYICDYVFKKNIEYHSNEKNLQIIKRENDKIANKRKLDNARTIRILIENKRINSNKQLIEKWMRPEKYISRKVDNNNYKILLRNHSQDDILKIKKINHHSSGINEEMNNFIEVEGEN